jgi:hypothetical protein
MEGTTVYPSTGALSRVPSRPCEKGGAQNMVPNKHSHQHKNRTMKSTEVIPAECGETEKSVASMQNGFPRCTSPSPHCVFPSLVGFGQPE